MEGRKEIKINKMVGIKDGEIYVLEECFDYNNGSFRGATGYHMSPLYQSDIDDMKDYDVDDYRDFWVDAVDNGETDDSLEDYINNWYDSAVLDGRYGIFDDDSFRYEFKELLEDADEDVKNLIKKKFGDDVVDWNCSGCGRCFDCNEKYEVVFSQELINKINEYEKPGNCKWLASVSSLTL